MIYQKSSPTGITDTIFKPNVPGVVEFHEIQPRVTVLKGRSFRRLYRLFTGNPDDRETFGFIFENLCIRDLLVYSSSVNGEVLYYNDDSGLEADCVVYLSDGRYALIEFKLGNREIDKGAENLLKLKKLIKNSVKNKKIDLEEPSFLAVITGGEMAYTRADGVKVIPIGCLR